MLNANTTKITVVDETRECLSRQMMLTYSVCNNPCCTNEV